MRRSLAISSPSKTNKIRKVKVQKAKFTKGIKKPKTKTLKKKRVAINTMFAEKYNPAVYQSIKSLHDSNVQFEEKDGLDFVEKELKPLILKYKLAKDFGVILVHRHFDMEESTILVEKDCTAAPWKFTSDFLKYGGGIVPSSWTLKDNKVYPYEFRFVNRWDGLSSIEKNKEFAREFFELVNKHGMAGCIGLRRTPIDPKAFGEALECTEGRVNIIFREGELSEDYLRTLDTTPTMWFFNENFPHHTYRCACQKHGSSEIHSHNHIHSI